MIRAVAAVIVLSSLAGCGFGPTCPPNHFCIGTVDRTRACTPENCSGCCTETGSCLSGEADTACGAYGQLCSACPSGEQCSTRECVAVIDACPADAGVVTTAQLHSALLGARCGKSCHVLGGPASQYGSFAYDVTTQTLVRKSSHYAGEQRALKVVDPYKPRNSSLWLMLTADGGAGRDGPLGEKTGPREPADGTSLSSSELQLVKDWICSGTTP